MFLCEPLQAECEGGFFMSFFVTADGGLTTAGYVGCVVLMVALVVIASVLSAQKSKGTGMDARKLAFCAMEGV